MCIVKETPQDVSKALLGATFLGILLPVWDFISTELPAIGLSVMVVTSNVQLQMILLLKESWVLLKNISNQRAASCYGNNSWRGVEEARNVRVRENCIYKLFKLYKMHVVDTCLSIYV